MNKNNKISRRDFLKSLATVGAAGLLSWQKKSTPAAASPGITNDNSLYMPLVRKKSPQFGSRVIHIHNQDATNWQGQTDYWSYVIQTEVDEMVNRGLTELTGTTTISDAWRALIPDYQPGQKIAIKVNFNNTWKCSSTNGVIDALIHPVNSIVSGLDHIGVARGDIRVYDAIRYVPTRFASAGLPGISYFDRSTAGSCQNNAGFSSTDPSANILFSPPPGIHTPEPAKLTDVLIDSTYLINIPIMKRHVYGVTLGFKNHFGSVDNPSGMHSQISWDFANYSTIYNPLVDLNNNPHIRIKTILTVGDGLFAAKMFNEAPQTWSTFGDHIPNSLFFSTDPVAIDCVMYDFLVAEMPGINPEACRYQQLAGEAGLGLYERGDPWGSGYQRIPYQKITL